MISILGIFSSFTCSTLSETYGKNMAENCSLPRYISISCATSGGGRKIEKISSQIIVQVQNNIFINLYTQLNSKFLVFIFLKQSFLQNHSFLFTKILKHSIFFNTLSKLITILINFLPI